MDNICYLVFEYGDGGSCGHGFCVTLMGIFYDKEKAEARLEKLKADFVADRERNRGEKCWHDIEIVRIDEDVELYLGGYSE